jgi:hypothetical protein
LISPPTFQAIALEELFLYVPDKVIAKLVNDGILVLIDSTVIPVYAVLCNTTNLNMTVIFAEQTITLTSEQLIGDSSANGDGYCFTTIRHYSEYGAKGSYLRSPRWILGYSFYFSLCISFDYSTNNLGLGFPLIV